jgi:hypothetical protein
MENNFEYVQETQEKKGSVITGFIGALLGAAIGAVAWAAVGMMGYIASIIGFVIAFLADKGYDLFKGRQGTVKMVILIICVVLAVAAGTLGTAVWQIHNEYTEQINALTDLEKKMYEIMTEGEFMKEILMDSEVQTSLIKDSALGLVFGILGSFGLISAAKNGKKKQAAAPVSEEAALEMAAVPQNTEQNDTQE